MEKTENLPEPLVPANVDLRNFSYMPLDVLRLRDSDLAAIPDAEAFRVAVLSWCVSWHQIPAASLPDDDAALARLMGFGRDIKGWKKMRESGGLRGWIKCSDGRIYHPVVAEKANEAWASKKAQRLRTEAARKSRQKQSQHQSQLLLQKDNGHVAEDVTRNVTEVVTEAVTEDVTDTVTASKGEERKGREGRGKEGKEEQQHLPSMPRARETGETAAAPLEENPEKAAQTKRILEEFDAAIVVAFGPAQARPWPAATDLTIARRLVDDGCTAELARGVFEAVCRRKAAQGEEPPKTLKYAETAVREAMKSAGRPRGNGKSELATGVGLTRRDQANEDMIREKHGSWPFHGAPGWWKREFPDMAGAA